MFGAAAMSLSSLFVVGNALRLRGFKAGERGPAHEAEAEDDAAEAWENAETGESLEAGENACPGQEIEKNNKIEEKQEERNMNKTMIIEGMMCAHCTGRVQKALEAVEGVESVVMSLEEKSAVLTLSSQVEDEALKAAVAEAGYEVTQIRS
jgi:copper chaperone CopZ